MFKDFEKYLSTSLIVYLIVLVIIFIMKLVGLDYFELDLNNGILLKMNDVFLKFHLDILWSYVICFLTSYITISLAIKDNSKKLKKFMLICFPITVITKYSGYFLNIVIYYIVQYLYLLALIFIYKKKIIKKDIFGYIKFSLLILIFQLISTLIRNENFDYADYNFVESFLMNLDYIIITIIYHKIYFLKGGKICYQEAEAGSYLQKKIHLKKLLIKLQENLHNFRSQTKEEKISFTIYLILSLIWNTLSVVIILLVARLNNTFIECIFILTSFWLSKRAFGKAFHLPSMSQCFLVSNLTYYTLNRIVTPIGISILIPIMLGVGLSYVTSKLVRKVYKPLYRGMPEDLFNETILKVTDKNSEKYNICYEFYIKKKTIVSLSLKYNYSEIGIRKIKDRINEKIKRL